MDDADNFLRVTALLIPAAWRLLLLRELAEAAPELEGGMLLTTLEFSILSAAVPKAKLASSSSAHAVLLAIAKLGGHIKQNGHPGCQVLWRGWQRLNDYVAGARLAGVPSNKSPMP